MKTDLPKTAGALLACALFAGPALAEGPRYTYAQLGYVDAELDDVGGTDVDGDGFNVGGSVAIADMAYVFAGYTDGEFDVDGYGIDVDYTAINAGIGVNYAVSGTVDLVGELAFVSAELEAGGFDEDEDGYSLRGGVRGMIGEQLELNGGITYTDLGGDYDSDTGLDLGAVYSFTDMIAGVAGISFSDDVTQYGIGVRVYFGR